MVFGCELRKPSVTDQEDETAPIYLPSRKCHKLYLFELLGAILFAGLLLWILYYPPTSENNLKIQIVDRSLINGTNSGSTEIPANEKPMEDAKPLNRSLFLKKLRVRKALEYGKTEQHPDVIKISRNSSIENDESNLLFEKKETCSLPKPLETATIYCTDTPEVRVCKSYCKTGRTFPDGTSREHFCLYSQNTWDRAFEECNNSSIENDESNLLFEKKKKCLIPKPLKTATIYCTNTPEVRVCKSYCKTGWTFPHGTSRLHFCIHGQNTWDRAFEECNKVPSCNALDMGFVDGRSFACNFDGPNNYIVCKIKCKINESEMPRKYYCIHGIWKPPLPFCVTQIENLNDLL